MTNFVSPLATGTMATYIKAGTRSSVHLTCASTPSKLLLAWQSASMNGLAALDDTDTSELHLCSHSQAMPSLCLVSYRMDTSFLTILNVLLISSDPHTMMNYHGSDECYTILNTPYLYRRLQMLYGWETPTLVLMALPRTIMELTPLLF